VHILLFTGTDKDAFVKSDATILNTLIFLILSWVLIGGGLYFVYESRTADFMKNQYEISEHGLNITRNEIENYISQSRHLLSLLIKNHPAVIQKLAASPASTSIYTELGELVRSYFPEMINFTLVENQGNILLGDPNNFIGRSCRADIEQFSQTWKDNEIAIHSRAHTDIYHIDILQKIPNLIGSSKGIFFVSLDIWVLQRLINNGQPYNHNFFLVRIQDDGHFLIEMGAKGSRSKINRDKFLTEAEIASIYSRVLIPGTKWEIVDLIDQEYLQANKFSYLQDALSIGGLYLILSLLFFYVFRRGELKRLHLDEEIRKLNSSLRQTVKQRTTQLEQSKQLLTYQATHDSLTGLKNRKEFEIQIEQTVVDAKHNEKLHSVVLYVDLDHFKIINETCGIAAGDEMIKQIAISLGGILRRNDLLARIGGDEFGILLRGCDPLQAELIARTIRAQIGTQAFMWDNKKFDISASIGVAEITEEVVDAFDLLREVESACSAAKEMGRNQVHLYHPDDTMYQNRRNEMYWSGETIRLIDSDRMELFGQKIQAISGQDIADWYEVLVRLRDKEDKLIYPDVFIPALEQYGGIDKLDRQVVSKSIEFLAQHPGIRLNINLSGKSVGNIEMLALISELIAEYQVLPESLVFEITETVAMTNISLARKFIQGIKDLGCQLALDDFGSGMSSFSYLKNLDVDYVKLDGSFVRNLHVDPVNHAMVESINGVVRVMCKECIAEFVENHEINQELENIGVAYGQGFYIHKPQNLKTIEFQSQPSNNSVDFDVS
jgi:diguanylate cyclase (GGDEF)-like protein